VLTKIAPPPAQPPDPGCPVPSSPPIKILATIAPYKRFLTLTPLLSKGELPQDSGINEGGIFYNVQFGNRR